jgi:ligand-binding sensor domain-containing protein
MRRLAILMVLSAFPLKSELLPIRTYTTADGLASDHIGRIVADSRGFLWFCTPEGLSRFDGNRFVNYGVDEGVPHPVVNTLIETRSGEHWIGTARGLSRIATNGKGPRFTNYRLGPETAPNIIGALLEARSGKLWVGTVGGLFEWTDPLHFRRREFPARPQLNDLAEDTSGNLWIGTRQGIYVYGESGIVERFPVKDSLPGDWVEMLLWDSKGGLWLHAFAGQPTAEVRAAPPRVASRLECAAQRAGGTCGRRGPRPITRAASRPQSAMRLAKAAWSE